MLRQGRQQVDGSRADGVTLLGPPYSFLLIVGVVQPLTDEHVADVVRLMRRC